MLTTTKKIVVLEEESEKKKLTYLMWELEMRKLNVVTIRT